MVVAPKLSVTETLEPELIEAFGCDATISEWLDESVASKTNAIKLGEIALFKSMRGNVVEVVGITLCRGLALPF
jgi:hypothetical protein